MGHLRLWTCVWENLAPTSSHPEPREQGGHLAMQRRLLNTHNLLSVSEEPSFYSLFYLKWPLPGLEYYQSVG